MYEYRCSSESFPVVLYSEQPLACSALGVLVDGSVKVWLTPEQPREIMSAPRL